ncbi:MAG: carboxypeptidase regulatory-like domain-containing protein [Betaproteobacteria bacterium]|nr:carboxypeptidase regulatory-like domain-containing protein [Betaproteobacteria bacterium]
MRPMSGLTFGRASAFLVIALAACGGGGGSPGPAGFIPRVMQGTAATGAPIVNAAVTVFCGSGEKKTTTTGSDGSYGVDVTGCAGPIAVSVSGTMGDTRDTLVSLNPDIPPPAPCGNPCPSILGVVFTNITPITHAIAALVSGSGDPLDLVRNFATEKSRITPSAVSEASAAITGALANVMTAAGISDSPPQLNPIGAMFMRADGTGWDRVLDNVKVAVTPAGITMTNITAAAADDMGAIANGSAAPALPANSQIFFTKGDFKTALATPMAASAADLRVVEFAREAANACFALPAAQRGSFANPATACRNLAASDYLNDGKTGSQEFDRLLADPRMDGARFNKPELLSVFSAERVLVSLSAVRSDGVVISLRSVAENSAATGNTWRLRGNQRPYLMFVNGVAQRRIQLPRTGAIPSGYTSALNLLFDPRVGGTNDTTPGTATGVSYVLVKGPGVPSAGQILRPGPGGCDQFFVVAASVPPAPLPDSQPCTSHLKIASGGLEAGASVPNADAFGAAPDFALAPVSDADIIATIQPMVAYTFEVHRANGTVVTFVERLRARPPTLQEMESVPWNALSEATQAAMVPGTAQSFVGGNFTVAWIPQPDTPPVFFVSAQFRTSATSTLAYDRRDVAPSASSTTLTNGAEGFPAASSAAGSYQLVNLMSATRSGLSIFSSWKY